MVLLLRRAALHPPAQCGGKVPLGDLDIERDQRKIAFDPAPFSATTCLSSWAIPMSSRGRGTSQTRGLGLESCLADQLAMV